MVSVTWDNVGVHKDVKTGEWRPVRIVIIRNHLHILKPNLIIDNIDITKEAQHSFKISNHKLEVGKSENYFCLYLISGHSRATVGFDNLELLEVKIDFVLIQSIKLYHNLAEFGKRALWKKTLSVWNARDV